MKNIFWAILIMAACLLWACGKNGGSSSGFEVVINDIPFRTEKDLRIGYTLKIWEYEKAHLELQQIKVLNKITREELLVIDKDSLPLIYKDPLTSNAIITFDTLDSYYLSIQLPIPLSQTPPGVVTHLFVFRNTNDNRTVTMSGADFLPRLGETPVVIASPVKGHNILFENQSKLGYHFNNVLFTQGQMFTSERFAFDEIELNDSFTDNCSGDPTVNTNYFNYNKPLYAVADGTIIFVQDGKPENSGNAKDVPILTREDYGGNYITEDIGGGRYAFYCHCIPGSITVHAGDTVHEGDELARLGNSGNSTAPHLHFQISDGPDVFFSHGVPFVIKAYYKTGEANGTPVFQAPELITDSMMEELTVFNVE